MSGDSGLFRTAKQLIKDGLTRDGRDWVPGNPGKRYVPLYEAKVVHHYDHRWATYDDGVGDKDSRALFVQEKRDPSFEAQPRYWVPIRAEARARLLTATAIGRSWLDQLVKGDVPDLAAIATRENRSERSVRMILSLAFLAPDIVKAAIEGTLPRGHGLSTLTDLPMDWVEQRKVVGLAQV